MVFYSPEAARWQYNVSRNHTVGLNMLTFSPFRHPHNSSEKVLHLRVYHNDKITSLVPVRSENLSNVIQKMVIVC